jgi:hypothetical protein
MTHAFTYLLFFFLVASINQKLKIMCTCHMVVEWFGLISVVVMEKVSTMGLVLSGSKRYERRK